MNSRKGTLAGKRAGAVMGYTGGGTVVLVTGVAVAAALMLTLIGYRVIQQ